MDLVYPYRHDKRIGNKTLIYSLRAIEKHLVGVDNVFIVGDDAELYNTINIPCADVSSQGRNIFTKILKGANTPVLSQDFMVMSDDHYILKDYNIADYPVYGNNTLENLMLTQGNAYKFIIQNTINLLKKNGKQTHNYNIHCPAIFNKKRVVELNEAYPIEEANIGFITKSLYFNHFGIEPMAQMIDCKIRRNKTHEEISAKISGRDCFSTGKEDVCPNIYSFLESLYPNKSKYET